MEHRSPGFPKNLSQRPDLRTTDRPAVAFNDLNSFIQIIFGYPNHM